MKLLILTLLIYFTPKFLPLTDGPFIFLFLTTWSLLFIALLSKQEGKIPTIFIGIESFSISLNLICFICYFSALKTAYIYEQRPHIITACFIAELLIIGVRALYVVGVDARIYHLRNHSIDGFAAHRINMAIGSENKTFTTQQAI